MYDQNGQIKDRREQLKIKIKSLAAESKMIRKEEKRLKDKANPAMRAYRRTVDCEYEDLAFRHWESMNRPMTKDEDMKARRSAAIAARRAKALARAKMRRPADPNPLREELYWHRTLLVRKEARAAHIAYGLIRGRSIEKIETAPKTQPDWAAVDRLVKKYGPKQDTAAVAYVKAQHAALINANQETPRHTRLSWFFEWWRAGRRKAGNTDGAGL